MGISITPVAPVFGARIEGVDLCRELSEGEFFTIREALDEYLILIIPNQPINDDQQIKFSKRFGPLEGTRGVNPGAGTPFARQSNLDIETGKVIPENDRRMFYQKANMLWHADSTFKTIPSLCSVLSARTVPFEGGATEFASTRAAYKCLSEVKKREIEGLLVEHDFVYSRGLVGFKFSAEEVTNIKPAQHRLVRTNRANGKKSVMIGAHAKAIVGQPEIESRALLDYLLKLATRTENTFRHEWRKGDVVIWDNQAALHRATEYDASRHRRLMQRTTISSGVISA